MAGKITKILVVLAILQCALRADAQAVQTAEEALMPHEEQGSQTTWLARAGRITKILVLLGVLHYSVNMALPTVKVTEELLRQQEEERFLEMAELLMMERRKQEEAGLSPGKMLLLACQEWWFWVGAEILLVLFAIYWLPRQSGPDCDDGSQWEISASAQEQMEKEEEESKDQGDNPDSCDAPEKPRDKSWALWRIFRRDAPAAVENNNRKMCSATSPPG